MRIASLPEKKGNTAINRTLKRIIYFIDTYRIKKQIKVLESSLMRNYNGFFKYEDSQEVKLMFVTKQGQILGKENASKLDKLPLILRWWAKINPKFKRKYVFTEGV